MPVNRFSAEFALSFEGCGWNATPLFHRVPKKTWMFLRETSCVSLDPSLLSQGRRVGVVSLITQSRLESSGLRGLGLSDAVNEPQRTFSSRDRRTKPSRAPRCGASACDFV